MSQNFRILQGSDTLPDARIYINNNFDAVLTNFSGDTQPPNLTIGMTWYDTSKNILKVYNGTDWVILQPGVVTTLESSNTVNIGGAGVGSVVVITGTTTITSFGTATQDNLAKILIFSDALTIVHNDNALVLPNGENITTSAGDIFIVIAETTTKWKVFFTKQSSNNTDNINISGDLTVNGNTILGDSNTDIITIAGTTTINNILSVKPDSNTELFKVESSGVHIAKYFTKVVNSDTALTIDPSIAAYWDITVNANTTLTFVNGSFGDILYVSIKQDETGNWNIAYYGNLNLQYLPQVGTSIALYKLQWCADKWIANLVYSFEATTTNMLTQQWRQNPFKSGTVTNITGWTTASSLPGPLEEAQAIVTKNRVYLLGINFSTMALISYTAPINTDGTLGTWTTGPSFPDKPGRSQAILTKNRVYLVGGFLGTKTYTAPINSDGTLGTWVAGPKFPVSTNYIQSFTTKNRVYLIYGSSIYTAPVNFDGTLGTWTTAPSLPGDLNVGQAIVTKNRVYLLGCNGNNSTVHTAPIKYDGTLGTWTTGPSLPGPLTGSQAILTKNRVFLLGGIGSSTVYTAPINSDGTLGSWTTGTSLPGQLGLSQAIVTKSRVYLLGGSNNNGAVSTVYTAPFADGWEWLNPHSAYYEDNGII